MIEMTMLNVQVGVHEAQAPDGAAMRVLRVEDPSGIVVSLPMPVMTAVALGNALNGSAIAIAPAGSVPAPRG